MEFESILKSLKKANNNFGHWSKKILFFAPLFFLSFSLFAKSPLVSTERKSFVLIVSAYNASSLCQKALRSFAEQTYPQFRVVYVDDGSQDDTKQKVEASLKELPKNFSFVHHDERKGSLERLIEEAYKCKEEEIILFLEGNALLASKEVLQKLNESYTTKNAWVVWGQQQELETKAFSKCKKVTSELLFSSSMRKKSWTRSRIKSFYASLFKKIRLEDLFFRGKCFDESFDSSYMFALLEMAKNHVDFLPDTLCLYSAKEEKDPSRPCDKSPIKSTQMIRKTTPYSPLSDPFALPVPSSSCDLIVFSYDRPLQLFAFLESMQKHLQGVGKVTVLYRTSSSSFDKAYEDVKKKFPSIEWSLQSKDFPKEDFQKLFLQSFTSSPSPYILFAVDDMIVKKDCDLSLCIHFLEQTHAFFFSLRLGSSVRKCYMGGYDQEIPHHVFLSDCIFGWQLNAARGDWNYATSVDMTLYRKKDLKKCFSSICFHNPNELETLWSRYKELRASFQEKRRMGLCFIEPVVTNIPLNLVHPSNDRNMNFLSTRELLRLYENGYKIDILPIEMAESPSVHMEISPTFVQREKETD
jgi:hypothetical protein